VLHAPASSITTTAPTIQRFTTHLLCDPSQHVTHPRTGLEANAARDPESTVPQVGRTDAGPGGYPPTVTARRRRSRG